MKKYIYLITTLFFVVVPLFIAIGKEVAMESNVFKYRFKEGNFFVYEINVNGFVETFLPNGANKTPVNMRMLVEQRVESVKESKARIAVLFKEVRMLSGNTSQAMPEEGTTLSYEQDNRGNTSGVVASFTWQSVSFSSLVFPEHPLKPGDQWVTNSPVNSQLPFENKIRYTFEKTVDLNGRKLAIFKNELLVPDLTNIEGSRNEMKTSGKIAFDIDLGQIFEVESDSMFGFSIPVPELNLPVFTRTSIKTVMKLKTGK
ncbi:MAG: hypothetical protein HQM08_19635 [Candidatus Riflebacteria bacterium]|nr:hypothetical protein [Candidatus Riflebacteria bacterium]